MVLCGLQYIYVVVPATRDTYIVHGSAARMKAEFKAFVNSNMFAAIDQLHHAIQLGIYRDPLKFQTLELLLTPTMMSNPAIWMAQFGFVGSHLGIASGGIVLRRVGPQNHLLMQSDIYPSCLAIGIFGCTSNMSFIEEPWFTRLKKLDLTKKIKRTEIELKLDVEGNYRYHPAPNRWPVGLRPEDRGLTTSTSTTTELAIVVNTSGTNTTTPDTMFIDALLAQLENE